MDLFDPGAGPTGQVHDYQPGVLPNGVFWTMAIPEDAFTVRRRRARLRLDHLPLCDSLFFGNPVGIASQVSLKVDWRATSGRVDRGEGAAVDPASPAAFLGHFSDADCTARVEGAETGFCFETVGKLDASGFFAEFGEQANGAFL